MSRPTAVFLFSSLVVIAPQTALARRRNPTITTPVMTPVVTPPPDPNAMNERIASGHIESGSAYFQVSRYEEALREFQTAYDLVHSPLTLFNLGRTHEALGHFQEAIVRYEAYLATGSTDFDRAVLQTRIDNLRGRLRMLPTNGASVANTPITPGTNNTTTTHTTAVVTPGTTTASGPTDSGPSTRTDPSTQNVVYEHRGANAFMPFVLLGVGGAIALSALIPGVMAGGHTAAVNQAIANNQWTDEATIGQSAAPGEIAASYVLGIAGGAVAVGGLVWFLARGRGESRVIYRVEPHIGQAGVGITVGGRF